MKKFIGLFLFSFVLVGCYEPRPYFEGLDDLYIELGEEYNLRQGVVCKDADGVNSIPFEIDWLVFEDDVIGEYRILYKCTDEGFETSEGRNVYIVETTEHTNTVSDAVLSDENFQLLINDVYFNDSLHGYNAPDEYQYVSVCITYKNISDEVKSIMASPSLISKGETYYYSHVEMLPSFRFGDLEAGGIESGCLTFEAPINDEYLFKLGDSFEQYVYEATTAVGLNSSFNGFDAEDMIGSIVSKPSYSMQVLSVETERENPYITPREGYEFMIVDVVLKNDSDMSMYASAYDFYMLDSLGYIAHSEFLWLEDEFIDMDISPGGSVKGRIGFIVPIDEENPVLIYNNYLYEESRVDVSNSLIEFTELKGNVDVDAVSNVIGSIDTTMYMSMQVVEVNYQNSVPLYVPMDGYEILIVSIRLKNTSDETQYYSDYDFTLTLATGQELSSSYFDIVDPITSGSLFEGELLLGNIAFEIPINAEVQLLNYSGSTWGEPRITFNLLKTLDSFTLLE